MIRHCLALIAFCVFWLAAHADSVSPADRPQRYGHSIEDAGAYMKTVEHLRQLRIPMRDGVSLNADIYFPDGDRNDLPTVLVRTPYEFSKEIGVGSVVYAELLKSGYAVMFSHERGRHYSEGEYTFLAGAFEDGYDTVDWIAKQPWSNGKVGTFGCSSSAEHQLGLSVADHPAHAAMIPMAPGAGIGDVGPYQEQGNFYRGGVWQGPWFPWYYILGTSLKPNMPQGLTLEERQLYEMAYSTTPSLAKVDFVEAVEHLPLMDLLKNVNGLPSDFDELIQRTPGDPKWQTGNYVREGDQFGTPALWVLSWYDIATAYNIAYVEHQRSNAKTSEARDNQFMVIGPLEHCRQGKESAETYAGERPMGDARFDYLGLFIDWFDYWLKGKDTGVLDRPRNAFYHMGINEWRYTDQWPGESSSLRKFYLGHASTDGGTNKAGSLGDSAPEAAGTLSFSYDPLDPAPSAGGSICCFGDLKAGAFDQGEVTARDDVLSFTSAPFTEALDVTGHIEAELYVSSDAPDTDITIKLVVVEEDGTAYNLDDSIQRMRYRNGYDKPEFMAPGQVYPVSVGPIATSNRFLPGQRLRVEISSSNFPRYGRNLNTGGNNYDEVTARVARNTIHFSAQYPSHISVPVQ
ncbi:MAG: CocE/NonD family hydrolase [Pseudomonadota bacterium]